MSKRQLLREYEQVDYSSGLIRESGETATGGIVLRGIIQRANTKNQNNRIYPRQILVREVEAYNKSVRENRALGELDHPDTSTVSLDRVSHIVREMSWNGDEVHGVIEVLPTPKGMVLKTLIDSGVTIGISSRGVGSTSKNESGCDTVQDDFNLVAFDIVSEPSTPGAYLQLREGVEYVLPSREDRVYRQVNNVLTKKGLLK